MTRIASLFALSALVTITACSSEETPAYANITVSFAGDIVVDQLRLEVLQDNVAITDPAVRPEAPGEPLTTDVTVTVLLPNSVVGRNLSVRVTGLYQGAVVTSGRVNNIFPIPERGIDVRVVLGHVLTDLSVSPTSLELSLGEARQLTAQGTFTDEADNDATQEANWVSSDETVATVNNDFGTKGLVRGVGVGSTTIILTLQDRRIEIPVTVGARRLVSVEVTPSSVTVAASSTTALFATATFSDGATESITEQADWTSSNTAIATVNDSGVVSGVAVGTSTVTASFDGQRGTCLVTVASAGIVSLLIEPDNRSIPRGAQQQYQAFTLYSNGNRSNVTSSVQFTTTPSGAGAFQNFGLLTANTVGPVTINGSFTDGVTGQVYTASVSATITDAQAERFTISASATQAAVGQTVTYRATAEFSDGSTRDITNQTTWSSSNTAVATITTNVAQARGVGTTTITATPSAALGLGTSTVSLSVTDAVLDRITVAPSSAIIHRNQIARFTATGVYSDGRTQNLTNDPNVTWSSNNTGVARVPDGGDPNTFIGVAPSATAVTIRATYQDSTITRTATAALTVSAAPLLSVSVTPSPLTLKVGTTRQMVATGTFQDVTGDLTESATWSIANQVPDQASQIVAAVGAATGLVEAQHAGRAEIRALFGGVTGTANLFVDDANLTALSIPTSASSVIVATTLQLTARATYADNTQQTVTDTVNWSSSNTAIASVNNGANKGLVTGVAAGSATITARSGSFTATKTITVSAATVTSVAIDQTSLTLAAGGTGNLTATASYNNGTTQAVTLTGSWLSSDTSTATVDDGSPNGGTVRALAGLTSTRTTDITVSFGGRTSPPLTVSVNPAALTSIAVTPNPVALPLGESTSLTATGTYADNSTRVITTQVSWSSSDTSVATVGASSGVVTTQNTGGPITIRATLGSVSGTTPLTVNAATTRSVAVTCSASTVAKGLTINCTAIATRTNNTTVDITSTAIWSTNPANSPAVTVDTGQVTGVQLGTVRIVATGSMSGISGTSDPIEVTAPVLNAVQVRSAVTGNLTDDSTRQFTAHAIYSDLTETDVTIQAAWSTSDEAIATVTTGAADAGLVTGEGPGTVDIRAVYQTVQGVSSLTVVAP